MILCCVEFYLSQPLSERFMQLEFRLVPLCLLHTALKERDGQISQTHIALHTVQHFNNLTSDKHNGCGYFHIQDTGSLKCLRRTLRFTHFKAHWSWTGGSWCTNTFHNAYMVYVFVRVHTIRSKPEVLALIGVFCYPKSKVFQLLFKYCNYLL